MAKLLTNTWLYRQPKSKYGKKKKKPQKKKLRKQKSRLEQYGEDLNRNLPRSEAWFQQLWKERGMECKFDHFNCPFGPYIPDVLNKKHYYIIEIDGSIHTTPEVKERDQKKSEWFRNQMFTVIRVIAYDMDSFNNAVERVQAIRKKFNNLL